MGKIWKSDNKALKYFSASMIFSYFLFITSPLIDIIFIVGLLLGAKSLLIFVLIFYLADVVAPAFAFKLEKENLKPLKWVFIQRFVYRYFISYATWKAIISALKGEQVGWNKVKRSGHNEFTSS